MNSRKLEFVGGGSLKKNLKIIWGCLIVLIFAAVIFRLWEAGAFIFTHAVDIRSNHVTWNGKDYLPVSGEYTEGRTLAKAESGGWVINAVKEDPTHTFVVARSFLDQYLMVLDEYTVPEEGELTVVSWNGVYISDALFLEAVSKIEAERTTSFSYQTDGIFQLTENQHMRRLCFAYENCPVATNYKGYMGKVNGEWVITTYISQDTTSVDCYQIPYQYWDILSEYFS